MPANLPTIVRAFEAGKYGISQHAYPELDDDGITTRILEHTLCYDMPEIIEDYPDSGRGPSCLILAWINDSEPLHAVVGYGGTEIILVTSYRPDRRPEQWRSGFRRRP